MLNPHIFDGSTPNQSQWGLQIFLRNDPWRPQRLAEPGQAEKEADGRETDPRRPVTQRHVLTTESGAFLYFCILYNVYIIYIYI